MRFLTPYFGNDFSSMLVRFALAWNRKADLPLTVLTDRETSLPATLPESVEVLRVTPCSQIAIRRGNNGEAFDIKAALVLAYLSQLRTEPCAIMDCDNHIHRGPVPLLTQIASTGLVAAMPDPGAREIKHPAFPQPVHEQSSSCMTFPADGRATAERFVQYWRTSIEPEHFLLEQRTWTLVAVAHGMVGPRSLSWSRAWGGCPYDTILEHRHGDEKWKNPPNA